MKIRVELEFEPAFELAFASEFHFDLELPVEPVFNSEFRFEFESESEFEFELQLKCLSYGSSPSFHFGI